MGGGGSNAGDDDQRAFERAMQGVEPLPEGSRTVARRRRASRAARPAAGGRRARFLVEETGDRIAGRAAGADRRRLRALERGEIPVELRLDLHGMTLEEARVALESLLVRAAQEERRCLLVIHGRGLSSEGAPVLKEAVPRWLTEPPAAPRVLAFVSAPPRLGGAGALLVLLRSARARGAR